MNLLTGLIFGTCALLTALSTAICLRFAHRHRPQFRLARRARIAASATCCVASLLAIPQIADAIDNAAGCNETACHLSDLSAVVFFASLQIMIVDWTRTRPYVRTAVAVRLLLAAVVIGLLVLEFHRADTTNVDLTSEYAHNGAVTHYLVTYLAYSAIAGLEISVYSLRLALAARRQRRAAATGLTIAGAGGVIAVAYALSRCGYLIAAQVGHAWPLRLQDALSPALAGLAIGCVAIGLAVATIGYNAGPKPENG
ncbi:hypothetical protein K7472_07820 [Streptomyces sp. PTM05]|uniref:Integral membrane protein n=1 Tax=Streptantibioticus parmotrematis TaxID=2873249 RepID=A0ABS7QNJ3_9ACTN|nr:hypothetical protein [Streptantibioticus parmotrematis]MBY8884751.1 hypothetical protein [Streptantibioticus parmotrematis]